MADIVLYDKTPERYLEYQSTRPDYFPAINRAITLASTQSPQGKKLIVVDFCSGPGANSRDFAQAVGGLERTILIDINDAFLAQAQTMHIATEHLDIIHSNILDAQPTVAADVVLATFSYHHIPDAEKSKYVLKAKEWLRPGGIVALAEIYLKGQNQNIEYYDRLLQAIPEAKRSEGLITFLKQTARSTHFEYKVSKEEAERDWTKQFKKIAEERIWPHETEVMPNCGTFVQLFRSD